MERNSAESENGATMVECAIVLPLFLLLVFGILEFSRYTATRSLIEAAEQQAGEYGATLQGDCLTPARDRFFEAVSGWHTGSELTFSGEVVPFTDEVQAIQGTVTGSEPTLLALRAIPIRLVRFFPIEIPFGCSKPTSISSTTSQWAASKKATP